MDIGPITEYAAWLLYAALAAIALWGAFCVIIVWRRVGQTRFRNEDEQSEFLDKVEDVLAAGDFEGTVQMCDGDPRAMPQLVMIAVNHRDSGFSKVRSLLVDRFQRDVLSDLEYRLSWVYTVIKSAPMVGLLGTVVGMMGAFSKLAGSQKVEASALAENISLALVTTACGLAIAIPLVLSTASINVRIRKMEDLVGVGLTRFLDTFKKAVGRD
ncbi:MAG: MotA/TolQ/ExbB proton channel family protein [Planctomycetes bacterium]|nr:MotA/TolQ/ExbB proton channel family protein [Planctomycetota bacterium]